jgi:hypothetical protein
MVARMVVNVRYGSVEAHPSRKSVGFSLREELLDEA